MTRLLRLLREAPGAVEADLIALYQGDLPEDWRARRIPSLRRLCVIVANLGEDSAVRRHERKGRPEWTAAAQVLDDFRRTWISAHLAPGEARPEMHPLSPLHPDEGQKRAMRRERTKAKAAQERREAARQARIAQRSKEDQ